jgi:hypothetical protein
VKPRTDILARMDLRLLAALPMDLGAGRWLTPADVSERLSVAPDVARSVLVRLRALGLALDDGERPQAFARTARADVLLEHAA